MRVVTQNIDDLERDVGLGEILGPRLIQAHGSFSQPPLCVNERCPGFTLVRELHERGGLVPQGERELRLNLEHVYRELRAPAAQSARFAPAPQTAVLQLDERFLQFHPQVFAGALCDNAVPCCPYCGAALKPSMVLYEEEINLPQEFQRRLFADCRGLLVIGTSLNVEPVSHLPAYLAPDAYVHIVAKELDFRKYLTEPLEGSNMFAELVQRRFDRLKYKSGDESRAVLIKHLLGEDREGRFSQRTMNLLTPYLSYHQGDCDQLVAELLAHLPEARARVAELAARFQQHPRRARQRPNYRLAADQRSLEYRYAERRAELQLVLLAVPQLWPPDAAVYWVDAAGCYAAACLVLREQYQLIVRALAGHLRKERVQLDGREHELLLDTRCADRGALDRAVYTPIGGHWATYCVAYNSYSFQADRYQEHLDPWSANFMGYQSKGVYYNRFDNFFTYQGVWRNFYWMHKNSPAQMRISMKATQHVLLGEDYAKLLHPILFGRREQLGDV